jgi:transcriptional regulator with XRE-family HTH domain
VTHALEPRLSHPLLWALEELLGVPIADVADLTGVTRAAIYRLRRGQSAQARHVSKLQSLLERTIARVALDGDDFARHHPYVDSAKWRDHRRHVFAVANAILSESRRPSLKSTEIRELLLKVVGPSGHSEEDVLQRMKPFDGKHVRRVARELGVRVTSRDDERYWLPPSLAPALHRSARVKLRTRRSKEVWSIVERLLSAVPVDGEGYGWMPVAEIEALAARRGVSRQILYRVARDVDIPRKTVGFGRGKRTAWSLPALTKLQSIAAHDSPDSDDDDVGAPTIVDESDQ